jgi:hypothetical protein
MLPSEHPPEMTLVTEAPSEIVDAMRAAYLHDQRADKAVHQHVTPQAPPSSASAFRAGDESIDPNAPTLVREAPSEARAGLAAFADGGFPAPPRSALDEESTLASASPLAAWQAAQAREQPPPAPAHQPPAPQYEAHAPHAPPAYQPPPQYAPPSYQQPPQHAAPAYQPPPQHAAPAYQPPPQYKSPAYQPPPHAQSAYQPPPQYAPQAQQQPPPQYATPGYQPQNQPQSQPQPPPYAMSGYQPQSQPQNQPQSQPQPGQGPWGGRMPFHVSPVKLPQERLVVLLAVGLGAGLAALLLIVAGGFLFFRVLRHR